MSFRLRVFLLIVAVMGSVFALLAITLGYEYSTRVRLKTRDWAEMHRDIVREWAAKNDLLGAESVEPPADRPVTVPVVSRWILVDADGRIRATNVARDLRPDAELRPGEALGGSPAEICRRAMRDGAMAVGGDGVAVPVTSPDPRSDAVVGAVWMRLHLHDDRSFGLDDMLGLVAGSMVLGTVLLVLMVYLMHQRSILRPLDRLVEGAERVAGGDVSRPIAVGTGVREVSRVVEAFNTMQAEVAEYRADLQARVDAALEEAERSRRALAVAQRLAATETLAGGIAHEINNPLGGMINAVRALRQDDMDDERRERYLQLLEDGLERVGAIVRDVLRFSPRTLEPERLDLRGPVERALRLAEHRVREQQVTVEDLAPEDPVTVEGEPGDLQQLFLNLVLNSLDALAQDRPDGGGTIRILWRIDEAGEAAAVHAGPQVRVTVEDDGPGMDPEDAARAPDLFFSTKSGEDGQGGTGLGLSIAHHAVDRHGGRLDIETAPGEGFAVTVVLPLADG